MTATLGVKLVLTPILVVAASIAGRRWGSRISGWLAGFPFTSAPVAVILTIEHGVHFTAAAATATVLAIVSQAAFAVTYVRLAHRVPWPACVVGGSVAFAAFTAVLAHLTLPPLAGAVIAGLGLAIAIRLLPPSAPITAAARPPAWDLPVRAAVATALVVVITAAAAALGATLTGLLTPYPLYATVLAVFAHIHAGSSSGAAVMRGLVVGLFGFGSFFLVLALLIVPAGPVPAFAAAMAAVVAVQMTALRAVRRI